MSTNDLFAKASSFFPVRRSSLFNPSESVTALESTSSNATTPEISTSANESSSSLGGRKPEDISKEDLLTLCMKLSKRLKLAESRAEQLSAAHKQCPNKENEHKELVECVKRNLQEEIQRREQIEVELHALRESTNVITSESPQEIPLIDSFNPDSQPKASNDSELTTLPITYQHDHRIKHIDSAAHILELEERIEQLKLMNENEKARSGRIQAEAQLQLDAMQKRVEASSSEAEIYLKESAKHQEELLALKVEFDQFQKTATVTELQNSEYLTRISKLQSEINDLKHRLEASQAESREAFIQMSDIKSSMTRLKQEKERAEISHATSVAQAAADRTIAEELQDKIDELKIQLQREVEGNITVSMQNSELLNALRNIEDSLKFATIEHEHKINEIVKGFEEKRKEDIATLSANLEEVKEDAAKRSQAARRLIAEKDGQISQLQARIDELENSDETSALLLPQDPRLLRLAKSQAAAEMDRRILGESNTLMHASDINTNAQVNLQYIKNVIVQYMSFGAGTRERGALVPVVATLLHFTDKERERVMQGLQWEWWGGLQEVKTMSRARPLESSHP